MCWFIRKVWVSFSKCVEALTDSPQGESYPEGKPSTIEYQCDIPVLLGHMPQTEIDIYSNNDKMPPVHADSRTRFVATLFLDLNRIPDSVKRAARVERMGNHRYYAVKGGIEARYGSAMITYTAKLGGESCSLNTCGQADLDLGVTHDAIKVRYEQ